MYTNNTFMDELKRVNIFKTILAGFAIGLNILIAVSVIFCLKAGSSTYYATSPSFYAQFSDHLTPTLIAFAVGGLFGIYCSFASLVYEIRSLNLLTKSLIHMLCTLAGVLITGNYLHWYPRPLNSLGAMLGFLGIFLIVYLAIWTLNYLAIKRSWEKINKRLNS